MRTRKMDLATEVLDYIPQEYRNRIDYAITFADIIKNHDGVKRTLVDSYDDGSTYTELYAVHSHYVDQDIACLVTRYYGGKRSVTYEVQRDLQGPQAQSLEDIDGYEWIDVYDMIIDAIRYL